ncbi:hypothetical protein U6K02_11990, partial [Cutibacterium acnes]
LTKPDEVLTAFYDYAKAQKQARIDSLFLEEKLKGDGKFFIERSIENGFVSTEGAELDSILPPTSRRHGAREVKKQIVFEKIQKLVEVFVGI